MALAARADLVLMREAVAQPARYYHRARAIVLRAGMLLEEERRHLWHELVHSDAGDEHWHVDAKREARVDREAAARAMPERSLAWAFGLADDWHTLAGLLKLPEGWVRWYVRDVRGGGKVDDWRSGERADSAC